jgi:phosphoglycerate transport regulatory protein PgtC
MLRRLTLLFCASLVSSAALAQAPAGKVTVITSFSKEVTDPVKKAFEAATSGATLEVQNRNTNAGVKYLEETRANNQVDLFWASAPDAFEVLKGKGLLQKYTPKATGIPEKIGQYPINDPAGFYFGFAASGYGIMWNERYAKANKLPEPKEWQDLAKPAYYDHVSIAAPSRSGTTHLTVEAVLQGEGWAKGWATVKAMAGNFRNITERSFGVPEAVNSGQVGYGIVIDFFAFSAQAAGFPVKFIYHHHRAGQRRRRRQCSEQGRRRSFRRIPAVASGAANPVRSRHPPSSGQPRCLRQGTGRLSESFQGCPAELDGQIRRHQIGSS